MEDTLPASAVINRSGEGVTRRMKPAFLSFVLKPAPWSQSGGQVWCFAGISKNAPPAEQLSRDCVSGLRRRRRPPT